MTRKVIAAAFIAACSASGATATTLPEDAAWQECVAAPKRACVLDQAIRIARSAGDAYNRSTALTAIAAKQAKDGPAAQSDKLFEEAAESARSIKEENSRAEALSYIAASRTRRAQFPQAQQVAASIGPAEQRARAFLDIGRAQAAAELFKEAEAAFRQAQMAVRSMKSRSQREDYLLAINSAAAGTGALAAEKRGNAAEAIEIARSIGDQATHRNAVSNILYREALSGRTIEALRLMRSLQDDDRAAALGSIIRAANLDRGQKVDADFKQLLEIAQSLGGPKNRADAFLSIADAQLANGLTADARAPAEQALEAAQSIKNREMQSLAIWPAAVKVAGVYAQLGLGKEAGIAFDTALQAARSIISGEDRAEALGSIAAAQAKGGLAASAHASFDEALRTAQSIDESSTRRPLILKTIAEADGIPRDQALQAIRSIKYFNCTGVFGGPMAIAPMPVLKSFSQEELPAPALCVLAITYAAGAKTQIEANSVKEAEASLRRALDAAKATGGDTRSTALGTVAAGYAYLAKAQSPAGLPGEASAAFDQALQVARSIDDLQRANALGFIASVQAVAGLKADAARIFEEALQAAKEFGRVGHHDFRYITAVAITRSQVSEGLGPQAFAIFYRVFDGEHASQDATGLLLIADALPN